VVAAMHKADSDAALVVVGIDLIWISEEYILKLKLVIDLIERRRRRKEEVN
jgi:hypothetical protein